MNRKLNLIVNGFVAVLAGYLFYRLIDQSGDLQVQVREAFAHITILNGLLILSLGILNSYFKSYRISFLATLKLDGPSLTMFNITNLHSFIANILPGKLGEAALPILLKKFHQIDYFSGAGILLLIRAYDFFFIFTLFVLSGLLCVMNPIYRNILLLLLPIAALAVFLLLRLRLLQELAKFVLARISLKTQIREKIEILLAPFGTVDTPKLNLAFLTLTNIIWISNYLVFFIVLNLLGTPYLTAATLFGAASTTLTFALPISGIANAGPMELAWATALSLAGYEFSAAIASGVIIHLIGLVTGMILALGSTVIVLFSEPAKV